LGTTVSCAAEGIASAAISNQVQRPAGIKVDASWAGEGIPRDRQCRRCRLDRAESRLSVASFRDVPRRAR